MGSTRLTCSSPPGKNLGGGHDIISSKIQTETKAEVNRKLDTGERRQHRHTVKRGEKTLP